MLAAAACLAAPLASRAQPSVRRIGFLGNSSAALESGLADAFRRGLRELGYSERNLVVDFRWAEGKNDQLAGLAAELAAAKASVIITGGTPGTLAARRAAPATPIVMVGVGDPVGAGLVTSLSRPGGNVTGIATLARDLEGKRLQFLREVMPKVARMGVLMNPGNPFTALAFPEMKAAATALGIALTPAEVKTADQFAPAFAAFRTSQVEAITLVADRFLLANRAQIVDLATKNRLPGVFPFAEFAQEGGLMSYAPDYPDMYRRAAGFVDRILKGMKPADIPVEQPTKFELVFNLPAAKQLGITLTPALLVRADRVIQ